MEPNLTLTKHGNYFCQNDPGEINLKQKRYSVTNEEVEILKKKCENKNVLEIGTGLGVSTKAIAIVAKRVTSVDIDPWTHSFSFPNNVSLLKTIPKEYFEIAFIDGSHKYENIVNDISSINADLFILHDCYLSDVVKAIKTLELKEIEKFNTVCDMRSFVK